MGAITDSATFDSPVYSIDTTDQLLGGPTGPLNKAAQNLANRTAYLLAALNGYAAVIALGTANHVITASELLRNVIVIDANAATLNMTLPPSTDLPIGAKAVITVINVNQSQPALHCGGSDEFIILTPGLAYSNVLYFGEAEMVELVLSTIGWIPTQMTGNFTDCGTVIYQHKQLRNTIIAEGQLLNRADYPRLWAYAQTLGASLVDDITWSDPNNRGFYSTGNGATTFRVPDLRAMFIRGLDLGAGIDFDRSSSTAGAYEADELREHRHGTPSSPGTGVSVVGANTVQQSAGTGITTATGGIETRPMNIGLLPLIKV